jgi:DNA-binding CsgD family transcriptional regulator
MDRVPESFKPSQQEQQVKKSASPIGIASFVIVGIGSALLAISIFIDGSLNLALPLLFLMLGTGFYILEFAARQKWSLASLLYIPGTLLLTFGLIFLINVLTQDWNAWAYAWMLLVAGIGVAIVQAGRHLDWPQAVHLAGWGLAAAGVTFFALFGAIAGGLFIQVMAPILVILGGLSLRWLPLESILPELVLKRFHLQRLSRPAVQPNKAAPDQGQLVEPLSARELEVLQLVDQGLSNQQIALRLNVAPSTVKTHINNIYGKLGVQTRVQAIHRARALGLLES